MPDFEKDLRTFQNISQIKTWQNLPKMIAQNTAAKIFPANQNLDQTWVSLSICQTQTARLDRATAKAHATVKLLLLPDLWCSILKTKSSCCRRITPPPPLDWCLTREQFSYLSNLHWRSACAIWAVTVGNNATIWSAM